jgi:hypothetical protein
MQIENQVCTLEQGEMLKEFGVKQESLFYHTHSKWGVMYITSIDFSGNPTSAYTVAELGEMLPDLIEQESKQYELVCIKEDECWLCRYVRNNDMLDCFHYAAGKTEAEARANMLEYLIESKLITIEEINNRLTCAPKK